MMGLIGQGCEHGDVLEVTGTNTPTQKTHFCVWAMKKCVAGNKCLPQKTEEEMIVVFVFVVQRLTQHIVCAL